MNIDINNEYDIVASIYDKKGNRYFIDVNKEIYCENSNGIINKIDNKDEKEKILELFRPKRTDIIR